MTDNSEPSGRWWRPARTLPMIRQTEAAECGLACLAMIASYHGRATDIRSFRQQFSLSLRGATLARLIEIADAIELHSRPLRLDVDGLAHLETPCILHWNMNHFVVLKEVRRNGLIVHDPALGVLKVSWADVSTSFTGVALELTPSTKFESVKAPPSIPISAITGRLEGFLGALAQVLGFAFLLEVINLLSPLFVQVVLDQVLADGDRDLLTTLGVGFLLLTVLQTGVSLTRSWSLTSLGANLTFAWTRNVFAHLLKLPEDFYNKRSIGDVVSRFNSISTIQNVMSNRFVEALLDGVMGIFTLCLLFVYSGTLAVITLASFSIYLGVRVLSYEKVRDANLQQIIAGAQQQTMFLEAVRGSQTIRLYNLAAIASARYSNRTMEALGRNVVLQRLLQSLQVANSFIGGISRVVTIWIGCRLVLGGNLSAGMLIAYLAYSDQFVSRAYGLIDYFVDLRMLKLHGERLADIVLTEPEKDIDVRSNIDLSKPSIEFKDVSFRYAKGEPWILHRCSFKIEAGESVAIVGPSGCGKSTLLKVLIGLLDPEEGEIKIAGTDLRMVGKHAFRSIVGTVTQDDQMFAGSIADNVCLFDSAASSSEISAALQYAAVFDEVSQMPMGTSTLVGDMGSSLSGGQKQRVMLARAFYKKPSILVLDEATSHLDTARERAVTDVISQLQITRVFAAHRAETIASATRVLRFELGRVEEVEKPSLKSALSTSAA